MKKNSGESGIEIWEFSEVLGHGLGILKKVVEEEAKDETGIEDEAKDETEDSDKTEETQDLKGIIENKIHGDIE